MPSFAVFLRAVNVGAHARVSVAAIAKELGLANIGAAGTFVAHGNRSAAALRKAIAAELGFDTAIMVVPAAKVRALVAKAPLARVGGRPFVAVLASAPKKRPTIPLDDGKGARLVGIDGPFALTVILPEAKPGANATGLVEKALGVPATVRGWATMERVAKALDAE